MPKTAKDSRPRIWAEGSQNPPFDARAFARASVTCAREGLSGLLGRSSAAGSGVEVATGRWRVPPDRLGRSGRFLPSVARTAAAIRGGAEVLARAGRSVGRDRAQEPAPPTIFTAEPAAPRPARPAPAAAGPEEDCDLAAIRALLREPVPAPRETPAPEEASPAFTRGRDRLAAGAGWLLGHALLVLALPVGAALAGIAHLNGEDLRRRTGG
ncbi:hypothetical protein G5B31_15020 [Rhodobacter sp. SGA-6-6]|uniref:hypothetical protein n=1 Tax=Rhodobacter sp. SGA-6-6 TaxID=2710882 RepID=UPI0013EC9FB0|nr:hypothetical protein [Rhodobacter sp. SGA-6-6]NGM46847.1 hypothetical protein [Rhodobacter sp. SGA-6-6]